jgi:hypothetical protein
MGELTAAAPAKVLEWRFVNRLPSLRLLLLIIFKI